MVREDGEVVKLDADRAIVSVVQTSACANCNARQGCGQAALSEWRGSDVQSQKNHFSIARTEPLRVGDRVTLGIAEDTLSLAAVWVYLWPLACAFAMLSLGVVLAWPESLQLAGALAGGAVALAITRRRFRRTGDAWEPRILSVHSPTAEPVPLTVRESSAR